VTDYNKGRIAPIHILPLPRQDFCSLFLLQIDPPKNVTRPSPDL
jgi:hypothetical protein